VGTPVETPPLIHGNIMPSHIDLLSTIQQLSMHDLGKSGFLDILALLIASPAVVI